MHHSGALKLFGLLVAIGFVLSQAIFVLAGNLAFGGEAQDHFWNVSTQFCTNGFTIAAQETDHGSPDEIGDDLPFSLQLGSSTPPVFEPVPAPIAGGFGGPSRTLASGQTTFLYTEPQAVGLPITITIERWDHGLFSPHETDTDDSDHSIDFDDIWPFKYAPPPPPNLVENCTVAVDRVPPTTTAKVSPAPGPNGWNTTAVVVKLNATDNVGGQGVKMIEYWATGAQPISRTLDFSASVSIPISITGETTLSYYAWDNAGNAELNTLAAPQTLTVKIVGTTGVAGAGSVVYLPLIVR